MASYDKEDQKEEEDNGDKDENEDEDKENEEINIEVIQQPVKTLAKRKGKGNQKLLGIKASGHYLGQVEASCRHVPPRH